jgi:hypothetical protein
VVSRSRWLSPAPCGQARRRCGAGSRAAPRARLPKRSERPAPEPMRIGDGGEPSADGRGLQARIGEVSEIGRRRRRARGERMRFRAFAPGLEILPIRSIRSPGRRGLFVGPRQRLAGSGACERREHQRFFGRGTYSLHCKGVTASGAPLPELTQPDAVAFGHGSPPSEPVPQ